jgi:hypothetical protein
MNKLYAKRSVMEQGKYYIDHVMAMTAEGLHSKADIAAELAHRDIVIQTLENRLAVWEAGTASDISRSMIKTADKLMNERNALKGALATLLYVINPDKDGSFFICEEATDFINEARKLVEAV